MKARIQAISHYVPEGRLDNEELAAAFPEWPATRIYEKTGIRTRHIAANSEAATDLGFQAAQRLVASGACAKEQIDYLILITQSPDYALPGPASRLHKRLRLRASAGALDVNLGCSGYVYGLSLAKGLIESGQCATVLLVTAETYSKHLGVEDKATRTLFGDGAAATLIRGFSEPGDHEPLGPFLFGADGGGADKLILRHTPAKSSGLPETLYMDGPFIFDFTIAVVPPSFRELLARAHLTIDALDFVVFHQCNRFILDALQKLCGIPAGKFVVDLEEFGNTVSSTIPIALARKLQTLQKATSYTVALVGFGVGLSWASCIARVQPTTTQTNLG
jgi:3-oxoacyl-[acyl-carrier-protein] synthase-3